ncbi:hypothetical protein PFMC_05271, partial [Plasmodium falciparum CAMP/Malaysia]
MAKPPGSPGTKDEDAKHALDRIGAEVQKIATRKAIQYNNDLHGVLSKVNFSNNEIIDTTNPCLLDHNKHTTVSWNVTHPCDRRSKERFSDDGRSQCSTSRITGNNSNTGACAPYRKLQLCDYNLERITDTNTTNTHNLLVDVLLAAKYEGQSITQDYPKYQAQYASSFSTSQICTMLARSFADIGDIIRGKDLYVGNRKEREKEELQKNLKTIFKKIYDNLVQNKKDAKDRYQDTENYYQLREDWWDANRQEVWKALTCTAGQIDKYFRPTCGSGETALVTPSHCRCKTNVVPTYFDYVPQYLRWFEEWAEDFCRKRKKKLQDAIDKCRGKYQGKDRYCDLNGYDCEKTKRGRNIYRWDYKCTGCFRSCSHFVKWIDNKKLEFEKQKEKYTNEINKKHDETTIKIGNTTINNLYVKEFYEKLKEDYGDVNAFLALLSKEAICQKPPEASGETADAADFTKDKTKQTFSHTTYCQACPWCGVKKKSNGGGGNTEWERLDDMSKCPPKNLYKPIDDNVGTPINFLYSGDEEKEIAKNLKAFCNQTSGSSGAARGGGNSDSQDLYQKWKCYQFEELTKVPNPNVVDDEDDDDYDKDVKDGGGLCILQKTNEEGVQKQKTFNPFFYYWVVHMLKDSIHWRTKKLERCLKNKKTCGNQQCKSNCECFERWVEQKGKEWKNIVKHFKTQKLNHTGGNGNQGHNGGSGMLDNGLNHDFALNFLLNKEELLENLQEAYGDTEDIKHIKKLLEEDETAALADILVGVLGGKDNTTIDKLLKDEGEEAEKCIEKHTCPPQEGLARKLDPARDGTHADDDHEEEEEEEEDDEEHKEDQEDGKEETKEGEVAPKEESTPKKEEVDPKVCDIVDGILTKDNLTKACEQKYSGIQSRLGWKCIPTSGGEKATSGGVAATGSESERARRVARSADGAPSGKDTGSICVPPRRRRLYVGKLEEWAGITVNGDSSESSVSGSGTESQADVETTVNGVSTSTSQTSLLHAFVKSAAVETFFLWHRYKKQKEKPQGVGLVPPFGVRNGDDENNPDTDPETSLKKGKIPDGFLRQMFYTLADYKDILEGKNDILIQKTGSDIAKDEMAKREEKIKGAIQTFFQNSDSQTPSVQQPSGKKTTRESWWQQHGKDIWHGMICALTYKDDGEKGTPKVVKIDGAQNLLDKLKKEKGTEGKYHYENVKLENSETEAKPTTQTASSSSGDDPLNNPKLTQFVEITPYFRYLEEWGETFCKERMKRLKQIKVDCRGGENGSKVCSGYGEDCEKIREQDYSTVRNFFCPGCGKHCRSYRKWIEKKKEEFTQQSGAYDKQKTKYETESNGAKRNNHGNGFCVTQGTCNEAKEFLGMLGSCKKENGKDKLDFDDDTFKPATNCKPCSKFKTDCKSGKCDNSIRSDCRNKNSIDAKEIETMRSSTEEVNMLVSDNSGNRFEGDGLEACQDVHIFKGIRKDVWTCGYVCGVDICEPNTFDGKQNGKEYIQIRALLKHWVHNFLEDYNKIRKKLKPCMNNNDASPCINGCKEKCKCVEKWINLKQQEWPKIRDRYFEQYKGAESDMKSLVKNFLEDPQFYNEVHKAIKPCDDLTQFEKSKQCNAAASSEKEKGKGSNKKDGVVCLLEKLQKKNDECNKTHTQSSGQTCPHSETPENNLPLPDDEEEEYENEDENEKKVEQPGFCPKPKETKEKEDEKCGEPESRTPEERAPATDSEQTNPEQTPVLKPESPAIPTPATKKDKKPPKRSRRRIKTLNVLDHPAVIPALMSSTIMWSIGIGFAAFTYFYLK